MIFHALRRLRLSSGLVVVAAITSFLVGCTRNETAQCAQRLPTPSMAETEGHDLTFTDSRAYIWADNR